MAILEGPVWGPKSRGTVKQIVVLCHGVGADGNDLIDIAPGFYAHALPDALFLSPHAPFPYDMAPFGRQWFSLADRTPAVLDAGVRRAADILGRFVDEQLAQHNLPADAYALMGFSQGAMTALFAGLRRPVAPRTILAYSGALLAPETLAAEMTAKPPVLIAHGAADPVVPIERGRAAEEALRAAGVPLETVYTAGLQHGISEAGLSAGALMLQRVFAG